MRMKNRRNCRIKLSICWQSMISDFKCLTSTHHSHLVWFVGEKKISFTHYKNAEDHNIIFMTNQFVYHPQYSHKCNCVGDEKGIVWFLVWCCCCCCSCAMWIILSSFTWINIISRKKSNKKTKQTTSLTNTTVTQKGQHKEKWMGIKWKRIFWNNI